MGKGKDPIATLLVQTTNWCTQIAYQTMSSGQQRGMANNIINLFNHYQHCLQIGNARRWSRAYFVLYMDVAKNSRGDRG